MHEEGLVYLNGYIRMIYNKATKSVYRLNYLSKKINIFNKDNEIDYFLVKVDNQKLVINTQKAYEKEKEKRKINT